MADKEFDERNKNFIDRMRRDDDLIKTSHKWFAQSSRYEYSYHFTWLGLPIIQFPQDILAVQEIIWKVRPDIIVETGIARGGSLILSASILELLGGDGEVVGIDIDIRPHNREAIEKHSLAKRITMIEGSSVDQATVDAVHERVRGRDRVLVILDSNHTHAHVREELRLYSPLVTVGSYLVVFDTIIEHMPDELCSDRPWGKGDNPLTAVHEFLASTDRFDIDKEIEDKLLITVAPDGYLRCVKD